MAFAAFGGNAPAVTGAANRKGGKIVLALLLPGLIYLGLFFLTPLISLIITSLETPDPSGAIGVYQYGFEIGNYVTVITDYLPQIFRSFFYALLATLFALLISYPLAYFIGVKLRSRPMVQRLLVTLVIAPFFISFLLRTIAWKQILSEGGAIMQWVHSVGLLGPSEYFIGTPAAVIFGLTYNFIPFMTLPLYTTLERFDIRLIEAGSDLYASPARVFRKITLPISMPGVISGTLLTFIPISGDYVNASRDFLGSSKTSMIGNMVEADFLQNLRYPTASALSVLLMAVILVIVSVYVKKSGTEDLL
jgi:spermidine/putrescine transport system permease protein